VRVGAPKNTPTEIVTKLNREINLGVADPRIRERLAQLGVEALSSSPADFEQLVAADTEKRGRVIRAANIKVE
jgi:tripartite-type tricarboxylate transporter receptor subunit TctC